MKPSSSSGGKQSATMISHSASVSFSPAREKRESLEYSTPILYVYSELSKHIFRMTVYLYILYSFKKLFNSFLRNDK